MQAQHSGAVATKNFNKQENDTPHFRIISDEQPARACAHGCEDVLCEPFVSFVVKLVPVLAFP